jgi:hypothetical protein
LFILPGNRNLGYGFWDVMPCVVVDGRLVCSIWFEFQFLKSNSIRIFDNKMDSSFHEKEESILLSNI